RARRRLIMRVLHVVRDDGAPTGGDTIQLRRSVAHLRDLGVDAVAATAHNAEGAFDVVHLYNLQLSGELVRDTEVVRRRWPTAAVALSRVYWPPAPMQVLRAPDPFVRRRLVKANGAAVLRWRTLRPLLRDADAVLPNSKAEVRRVSRLFRLPTDRW